jgi:hypothetical protein
VVWYFTVPSRSPKSTRRLKEIIIRQLVSKGAEGRNNSISDDDIVNWFPPHESKAAADALDELLDEEDNPIECAGSRGTREVWLTDVDEANQYRKRFRDIPFFWEDD